MDAIEFKSVVALLTAAVEAATTAQSAIADHAQAMADLRARIEALESSVGDTSQLPPIPRPHARAA